VIGSFVHDKLVLLGSCSRCCFITERSVSYIVICFFQYSNATQSFMLIFMCISKLSQLIKLFGSNLSSETHQNKYGLINLYYLLVLLKRKASSP
jgi:hypothetical protein